MSIQSAATNVVKKLAKAGYTTYFAGGWVRDYLMGHPSEDIDIATNAPPQVILDLFPSTILVGLAFGVVIVVEEGHQFEVATFRRDVDYQGGRRPTQIELSTPEEDALRRDFTINGMFYDPVENLIHDFVGGQEDLKHGRIRTIGDPYERFMEDRLRMIRAIRFSSRFAFPIEPDVQDAIKANAYSLFPAVAMERIWQEFVKMSKYPRFDHAIVEMHRLELLPTIFPSLKGIHLRTIKDQVVEFAQYPANCETILYLMALFPQATKEEIQELCQYLKTSNADLRLAEYLIDLRTALNKDVDQVDLVNWIYFYAHPPFDICLTCIAAHFPEEKRAAVHTFHTKKRQDFSEHIKRVVEKKPLVNAALLQKYGIQPGKLMGQLLKEAERISILQNIHDAEKIIPLLKANSLWPKV